MLWLHLVTSRDCWAEEEERVLLWPRLGCEEELGSGAGMELSLTWPKYQLPQSLDKPIELFRWTYFDVTDPTGRAAGAAFRCKGGGRPGACTRLTPLTSCSLLFSLKTTPDIADWQGCHAPASPWAGPEKWPESSAIGNEPPPRPDNEDSVLWLSECFGEKSDSGPTWWSRYL